MLNTTILMTGSRHGGVRNLLFSPRTIYVFFFIIMAESLLKYVSRRRNRSSDSSADGKGDSPATKKVKSTTDHDLSTVSDEHGEETEDSDIVLTALELTDDLRTVPTNSEVFLPADDYAREVDVTKGY